MDSPVGCELEQSRASSGFDDRWPRPTLTTAERDSAGGRRVLAVVTNTRSGNLARWSSAISGTARGTFGVARPGLGPGLPCRDARRGRGLASRQADTDRRRGARQSRYAMYLAGWPRHGDHGSSPNRRTSGCGVVRTYTEVSHGFGFVSADVPELSIAVIASRRHRGWSPASRRTHQRKCRSGTPSTESQRARTESRPRPLRVGRFRHHRQGRIVLDNGPTRRSITLSHDARPPSATTAARVRPGQAAAEERRGRFGTDHHPAVNDCFLLADPDTSTMFPVVWPLAPRRIGQVAESGSPTGEAWASAGPRRAAAVTSMSRPTGTSPQRAVAAALPRSQSSTPRAH